MKKALGIFLSILMVISIISSFENNVVAADTFSFILTNNLNWKTIYIYAWDADGNPLTGIWPGTPAVKTTDNEYGKSRYVITVPMATKGIIVSDGNDKQTEDISNFCYEGYYLNSSANAMGRYTLIGYDLRPDPRTVTTAVGSIDEGFENGIPSNWNIETSSSLWTASWISGVGDYSESTGPHKGDKNVKVLHNSAGESAWLITPMMNLSGKKSASLSFWYINRSWSGDIDRFGVFYRVDGGNWNELFKTTDGHNVWTEWSEELPASALTNNIEIGFKMTDNYGYGVGLDDVVISTVGLSHTMIPVAKLNPGCTTYGKDAYFHCSECGNNYEDVEGKIEISDIEKWHVLEKLGHDFGTNEKVCKRCGIANPNYVEPEIAKLPTVKDTTTVIKKTNTDKKDVSGSEYQLLKLKGTAKKQTIKLEWTKIKGADGYIIYGSKCGSPMEMITTINKASTNKYTFKKLSKNTYYKYMVVAYKKTAVGDKALTKSKSVHVATDGGKKGNPTKLTVNKKKVTIKAKKIFKIKAQISSKKKVNTHIAKFRYESANPKVAKVDKKGKIKGVKKGKTNIYVYSQNGLCKKIKVSVK